MKFIHDMVVSEVEILNSAYALLKLIPIGTDLPPILPGQFVQIRVPNSPDTFLRRPISVNFVDYDKKELWLLVRNAGEGTRHLIESQPGDYYNVMYPLGNTFSLPERQDGLTLLVGGGVGVAPLLYFGKQLCDKGISFAFALGARSAGDLLLLDEFSKFGPVHVSTEDGSMGEKGFITQNSIFQGEIAHIACCGPTPMMHAVAKIAQKKGACCEVSLENHMACGIGACLCCVEDTKDEGNVCVCTEGPVFNINRLKWEI